MGDFDNACRYAAKTDGKGFCAWLLGPSSGLVFRRWLDARTTAADDDPDRTGDLVADLALGGVGPFWAMATEFQAKADALMRGRGLEVLGRVWRDDTVVGTPGDRYNLGLAVVNLTGRGAASCDMQAGPLGLTLRVAERNLCDEDAAATVAAVGRGELARVVLCWVPLMRGGDEPSLIDAWKAAAVGEPEGRKRATYRDLAVTLSAAAGRRGIWETGLEGWEMETSSYLDDIRAEVRVAARAEGRVEGWAEGRAEGRAEALAEAVIRAVNLRFPGQSSLEFESHVRATTDVKLLDHLHALSVTATSLDDIRSALLG